MCSKNTLPILHYCNKNGHFTLFLYLISDTRTKYSEKYRPNKTFNSDALLKITDLVEKRVSAIWEAQTQEMPGRLTSPLLLLLCS